MIPPLFYNWVRLCLVMLWVIVIVMWCTGCAPAARAVSVDAPKLALALMVLGGCAVLCSLIGGVSLVKASRNKRDDSP